MITRTALGHLLTSADLVLLQAIHDCPDLAPSEALEVAVQKNFRRLVRAGLVISGSSWRASGYARFAIDITPQGLEELSKASL